MSTPTGLELDFAFGSFLDTNNVVPSGNSALTTGLSELGGGSGAAAADYLSLSALFESSSGNALNSTSAPPTSTSTWQAKKTLMEQQLQQEQNSLNALLSQHSSSSSAANAVSSTGPSNTSPGGPANPFSFATREDLETLAASASVSVASTAQTPKISLSAAQAQQPVAGSGNASVSAASAAAAAAAAAGSGTPNGGSNNYMFVATIVDPTQEDAPPQQMLFLPGSNQVIPMPSATSNGASGVATTTNGIAPMMALANLPVVFPQGSAVAGSVANNTKEATPTSFSVASNWSSLQAQQQQQQGLLGLNGVSGLSSLEETYTQALAPSSLDLSSLGVPAADPLQQQQQQVQHIPTFSNIRTEVSLTPSTPVSTDGGGANAANTSKAAMPVRPLSAYNFFFSDERERILQNKTDESDVFDNAKKQRLLLAHLAKDRSKRRPHRKTHGKINFTTLSKLIGQRWKQLPDERKNFYREVAAIDLERYQRELRERSPQNASPTAADF